MGYYLNLEDTATRGMGTCDAGCASDAGAVAADGHPMDWHGLRCANWLRLSLEMSARGVRGPPLGVMA